MREYRVYRLNGGHIQGPPIVVYCETDAEAIRRAHKHVDGIDVELWDGARLVWMSIGVQN